MFERVPCEGIYIVRYVYASVCVCVCTRMCVCVCHARVCVCVGMFTCACMCMHVYMYVCACVGVLEANITHNFNLLLSHAASHNHSFMHVGYVRLDTLSCRAHQGKWNLLGVI